MTGRGGDSPVSWRGLRWGRWRRDIKVWFGIGAVVVALPVAYLRFWPHDSSTVVGAGDAVDDFRSGTTGPSGSTVATPTGSSTPGATTATSPSTTDAAELPTIPAAGVYRYATTGEESVDILGGATHTYPADTTITVTHTSCGALLEWTALAERSDTWTICATPEGIVWKGDGTAVWHHQFFGMDKHTPTVCPGDALLLPAHVDESELGALEPVVMSCTSNDRDWPATFEVLGVDQRTVEGTTVDVVHVRLTVTWDGGDLYERSTIDYWLDRSGLPISMSSTKETREDSGVIGAVTYREQFTADLVSLVPLT